MSNQEFRWKLRRRVLLFAWLDALVPLLLFVGATGYELFLSHGFVMKVFFSVLVVWTFLATRRALEVVARVRQLPDDREGPMRFDTLETREDGRSVYAVTYYNGDVATVEAPPGYNPASDNGYLLVQLAHLESGSAVFDDV